MASNSVTSPFPIITDIDGQPLEGGYIWIGTAGLDPQTNPQNVYWDSALTALATQPVRTIGGYPIRTGAPGRLYVNGDYSIRVMNKNGTTIYSSLNYLNRISANQVEFTGPDGLSYTVADFADSTDVLKGDALISVKSPLPNSVARTQHQKNLEIVSVFDFGALGNGIATNEEIALNRAFASGAKKVIIPSGRYKCSAQLIVPVGVSIVGEGIGNTVLDFSGATAVSLASGRCMICDGGDPVQLPAGPVTLFPLARSITFASAPSLSVNDVIIIYNNIAGSWNSIRPAYNAGEMAKVARIVGNIAYLHGTVVDTYSGANTDYYKLPSQLSFQIDGLSIVGPTDISISFWGLTVKNVVNPRITNIEIKGASYTQLELHRCYDFAVMNCVISEDFVNSFGGDYGLAVVNCHIGEVSGGSYSASRHGITTGGYSFVGDVVNRYIKINNTHISTSGASQAADFHGNSEFCSFNNCSIDGGIVASGDKNSITNNIIRGECAANGSIAIYLSELKGTTWNIDNNSIYWSGVPTTVAAFINVGGNDNAIAAHTVNGGLFSISDNVFTWTTSADNLVLDPIKFSNRGAINSANISVKMSGNTLINTNNNRTGKCFFEVNAAGTSPMKQIEISDNNLSGCCIACRNATANEYCADSMYIKNNIFANSNQTMDITDIKNTVVVTGNTFYGMLYYGISINGISAALRTTDIHVTGNTIIGNSFKSLGTSSLNTSCYVAYGVNVVAQGNFVGSRNRKLTVTSNVGFLIGETITGAVSGATATVVGVTSTTVIEIGETSVGTIGVENITGLVSGTVTAVSANALTSAYAMSFYDVTNLWVGNNSKLASLSNYENTIGAKIDYDAL